MLDAGSKRNLKLKRGRACAEPRLCEIKPWAEEEEGNSGGWWVGENEVGGLNRSSFPQSNCGFFGQD